MTKNKIYEYKRQFTVCASVYGCIESNIFVFLNKQNNNDDGDDDDNNNREDLNIGIGKQKEFNQNS